MPPFFVKGEKIVLKKDGTWFADGIEITHEQTRDLFFKSIHWDKTEKQHYLEVGYERIFIEVEDTPYFVNALEQKSGGAIVAKLSNFTDIDIIPDRPDRIQYTDGNLYLLLESGERAKFLSASYYDLLRGLQEDSRAYYVTISGQRVNLSPKDSQNPAFHPGAPKRR